MFHKDLTGADIHETVVTKIAGNPNSFGGGLAAATTGKLALDTTTGLLWHATVAGTPGTWVLDDAGSLKSATTSISIAGATAPSTGQVLTAINSTSADWASPSSGPAPSLQTTSSPVVVSGAVAPSTGQVLTALTATTADWQTPSGGGTPASPSTSIQFNNSGSFGGSADLEWTTSSYGAGALGLGINLSATGAPTPSWDLDVKGPIQSRASSDGGGNGGFFFGDPGASSHNACIRKTVTGNNLAFDVFNGSWLVAMTIKNSNGYIGVANTNPSSLFSVGSTSQFQVDTNGDMVYIKSNPYSWPSTPPTAGQVLQCSNATGGILTWSPVTASAAGSPGWLQYNTGGSLDANGNLAWDNSNKVFSVGATPVNPGAPSIQVAGDVSDAILGVASYGSGKVPSIAGIHSNGTAAAPTATPSGQPLLRMLGLGAGTTGGLDFPNPGFLLDFSAGELWTNSAHGTNMNLQLVGLSTTTPVSTLFAYVTSGGAPRVGVNQASPNYTLDVNGDINFTGALRLNGVKVPYDVVFATLNGSVLNNTSVSQYGGVYSGGPNGNGYVVGKPFRSAGTLSGLTVYALDSSSSGSTSWAGSATMTLTIWKNGSDQTEAVTLTNPGLTNIQSDNSNTVSVAANDVISIHITGNGTATGSNNYTYYITASFTPS